VCPPLGPTTYNTCLQSHCDESVRSSWQVKHKSSRWVVDIKGCQITELPHEHLHLKNTNQCLWDSVCDGLVGSLDKFVIKVSSFARPWPAMWEMSGGPRDKSPLAAHISRTASLWHVATRWHPSHDQTAWATEKRILSRNQLGLRQGMRRH